MNGFLIIDKPAGMTSFDIVRKVRRWTGIRKVGHAGTLDPFATGVLPVAIGQATRLTEYVMNGDKAYLATLRLGVSTDTQDLSGSILAVREWNRVTPEKILESLPIFSGTILQLPPMYSALKKNGRPLYHLARQGLEVPRNKRKVTIHAIDIEEFDPPFLSLLVRCGKGTYVRTLGHDLGERLGCGAHLVALRRTHCGPFDLSDCIGLSDLQNLFDQGKLLPLVPPLEALVDWPRIEVSGKVLEKLVNGVPPSLEQLAETPKVDHGDKVCFHAGDRLVAIAKMTRSETVDQSADLKILKVFPTLSDC